eukprot:11431032-Alexandrium_andersonii.AAC.1
MGRGPPHLQSVFSHAECRASPPRDRARAGYALPGGSLPVASMEGVLFPLPRAEEVELRRAPTPQWLMKGVY